MKYKLMAVDIDGTLLNSESIITEKTKKAIKFAVEKGLIFTISTGRPIQGVRPIAQELDIDLPFITYNGAMVIKGKSEEILYECNMSYNDAKTVYDLGVELDTTIMVWAKNKLYSNKINERTKKYSMLSRTTPVQITDVKSLLIQGPSKILWYDEVDVINDYINIAKNHVGKDVVFHTSRPWFLEFVDKHSTKAIAMQKLGEYYGISSEEMIAVGDGFNDLSMIEYAGLGVAMANSEEEIKKCANCVTLSNDEDGVAHVIHKFVLENNE